MISALMLLAVGRGVVTAYVSSNSNVRTDQANTLLVLRPLLCSSR